jgi:predicted ATPase
MLVDNRRFDDRAMHHQDRLAETLTATISWSYDPLDADEQRLLRSLSVFTGAFALEAAEAVCADVDLTRATVGGSVIAGLSSRWWRRA